jgi:hypothetical protein
MKGSVASIADTACWSLELEADHLEAPRQREMFGIQVATTQCVSSLRGKRETRNVVNEMVDTSSERFAVIESHWTDRRPDRFVLAYHNEGSLRELIATPCIIAVGFAFREDAIKRIETCVSVATPRKQVRKAIPVNETGGDQYGLHAPAQQSASWVPFAATRGTVQRVLQHAVAAVVLIFYSRNSVSAFIRAFMGT